MKQKKVKAGTTAKEQLGSTMNAEERANSFQPSERLVEREQIQGTPFTMINIENKGWFLTMGNARITEQGQYTKEEILKKVEEKDWDIISIMCTAIAMQFDSMKHKGMQQYLDSLL